MPCEVVWDAVEGCMAVTLPAVPAARLLRVRVGSG